MVRNERVVVSHGLLSVFMGHYRVCVGEVELREPVNGSVNSPLAYGALVLNDNFFRLVKKGTKVYLGIWSGSLSDVNVGSVAVPVVPAV